MANTRYCKCHFIEGESEHWGLLDRKAFAGRDATPHYPPDTQVLPRHLKLELNFDWEQERVWGVTTYQLEVLTGGAQEITLNAVSLDVSWVRLGKKNLDFENSGEHLNISLGRKLKAGEKPVLEIRHAVTHPVAGIYFTKPDEFYPDRFKTVWTQGQDEDSRYYFPCFDQPNYKQTTEVLLHLPPGMFGLSNGHLVKKQMGRKEAFYHYKMELAYSTYLLSIVAGEFSEATQKAQKAAVKWYVQPGREKEGRNAFRDTARILKFFSNYTGFPYPYRHYTQIAVPEFIFGGMENFTVTTQTDLTLHDDRAALDMDSNGLVAHEAAHTWFGNIVTAKSWSHAWLHESFATYFDALYTRESKGEEEFRYQMLEDAETYFAEDVRYRRPIVTHVYQEPIDLFDAHLYPGGAVRLHHLKSIVGEDDFRESLRRFLNRHQYGLAETVDLMRCLEETTRCNHDQWLEQWIYRGGYPTLDLKISWDAAEKLATVEIKQTQKAEKKDEDLLFRLRLNVRFYFQRGEETFPIVIEKREEKFYFHLGKKPLFGRLDPDYTIPCKKVKLEMPRSMLQEQLKRDTDPIGRIQAADALGRNPSHEDILFLGERLRKERFWGVGERIAGTLAKIGGETARDELIRAIKVEHPKIRRGVVQALGSFLHDSKVAEALHKLVAREPSYRVEAEVFRSLGRIKDRASPGYLEAALDRPSHNDMVRTAIFQALGQLEDAESWPVLVAGAEYGAPRMSRGSAMMALSKLARRHVHLKSEALECFRRFAGESRGTPAAVFRGKLWAIQAMQSLGDLAAVPALRKLSDSEADGRLRRRARDAVTALLDSAKKPEELKTLRDDVDVWMKENKTLRDRLDRLEKKGKSKK